jgi:hypothetical protein
VSSGDAAPADGGGGSSVTADIAAAAVFSVDPFATLFQGVDAPFLNDSAAAVGTKAAAAAAAAADAEPLRPEVAAAWSAGSVAPLIGTPPADESSLLAGLVAAPSVAAAAPPPDAVDILLLEEARRRMAAVRLPPAAWGPGSSLSPRGAPVGPPMQPTFGAFVAAPPPAEQAGERSLIDL